MAEVRDVEVHLATCEECALELAQFREVVAAVGSLRDALEEPSTGFPQRTVAHVLGSERRWVGRARWLAHDRRVHVAAASVGAIVGAGVLGLLWWRAARRGLVRPRVAV